ncbi:septum formation initiator family protein [Akkermansiaceae bacterium]|nr:septum formation initiator family protein [Akkermansiaceae bacterium]
MARKYRRYYSKSRRDPEFVREAPKCGLIGKPTWIVFGIFVLVVSLCFIIPAIPQYQKLQEIEMELAEAERQEQELLKKSEQVQAEAEALQKNPGYLQARARDPLRYYRKGESVIQLER